LLGDDVGGDVVGFDDNKGGDSGGNDYFLFLLSGSSRMGWCLTVWKD